MRAFLDFARLTTKYWQALVLGGVFGVVGVVQGVKGAGQSALVWVVAALVMLLIAAFLAFRKVWKEREAATAAHQSVTFAAPVTVNIGTSGHHASSGAAAAPAAPAAPGRLIEGTPEDYKVVRPWDLLEPVPGLPLSIINRTFRYVELQGPALIGLVDFLEFEHVAFGIANGDVESILWPLEPGVQKAGVIAMQACVFEHCKTESIAFTGSAATLDKLRQALAPGSP